MASLIELHTIEINAALPFVPGEPAEVTQARELKNRIRVAGVKSARTILAEITQLPANEPARTETLEKIAWARRTVESPDATATILLRLSLAGVTPAATPTQILTTSDAAIEAGVTPMIPLLAKGLSAHLLLR